MTFSESVIKNSTSRSRGNALIIYDAFYLNYYFLFCQGNASLFIRRSDRLAMNSANTLWQLPKLKLSIPVTRHISLCFSYTIMRARKVRTTNTANYHPTLTIFSRFHNFRRDRVRNTSRHPTVGTGYFDGDGKSLNRCLSITRMMFSEAL